MSRNIMMNAKPHAVTGDLDPCKPEGCILQKCYEHMIQKISYSAFATMNDKDQCIDERMALNRCRALHNMPGYEDLRKQDDVPRAAIRKHPTASDRMVQEFWEYPGSRPGNRGPV